MPNVLRLQTPLLAFVSSVAAIYGAALVIVSRLAQLEHPDLIAGALTLDLTLLVPLLYYLLLVCWRGWPAVTVLPVFLASVAFAYRLIPETRHHVLDLVYYAAAVVEVTLVGIVVYKAVQVGRAYRRRAAAGLDVHTALCEAARPVLGPIAGNVLAYETAIFYYALAGWRRAPEVHPRSFTYHRDGGYLALAVGLMIAAGIEIVAVHALVWLWSPVAAWILTGISVYALFWLIGDTQAIRLRPIHVSEKTLKVRVGLRWTIEAPVAMIDRVVVPSDGTLPRRTPGYLSAVLLGSSPNRRIELKGAVDALGPYGLSRSVKTIDLQVDEPARFDAALKQAC